MTGWNLHQVQKKHKQFPSHLLFLDTELSESVFPFCWWQLCIWAELCHFSQQTFSSHLLFPKGDAVKVGLICEMYLGYNTLFWTFLPGLTSIFSFSTLTHSNRRVGSPIYILPRSYRYFTAASEWMTCEAAQLSLCLAVDYPQPRTWL